MKSISSKTVAFSSVLFMIVAFQNCAQQKMSFTDANESITSLNSSIQNPGAPSPQDPLPPPTDCASFQVNGNDKCGNSEYGLKGSLYYLLDKTNGETRAATLYDKNDTGIAFNSNELNSVNVLLARGIRSDAAIWAPNVNIPALPFTAGFKYDDQSILKDKEGKILFEAFALDLRTTLQLAPGMAAGRYEIAILSDDGSILDMDLDGDGQLESSINNDGFHSPKLMCSNTEVVLSDSSRIPMRLRYYQGPRVTIAMTLVMRKLNSNQSAGQDSDCGFTDGNTRWFGGSTTSAGYVPDYVNSKFGALLSRGWFVPSKEMFLSPTH